MSDLYIEHTESCDNCLETADDDSLTEDERANRMHECFVNALQDLAEMAGEE